MATKRLSRIARQMSNNAGETITEALVATLIVVLAFTVVCGAVVTAARVNTAIRVEDTSFVEDDADTALSNARVSIEYPATSGISTENIDVNGYVSNQGGYVYYESK